MVTRKKRSVKSTAITVGTISRFVYLPVRAVKKIIYQFEDKSKSYKVRVIK